MDIQIQKFQWILTRICPHKTRYNQKVKNKRQVEDIESIRIKLTHHVLWKSHKIISVFLITNFIGKRMVE